MDGCDDEDGAQGSGEVLLFDGVTGDGVADIREGELVVLHGSFCIQQNLIN